MEGHLSLPTPQRRTQTESVSEALRYGQQKYPSPAKTRVPGLEPAHDLVSLADYRLRHAFYRAWMWKAKRWSGGGVEEWPLGEGMEVL